MASRLGCTSQAPIRKSRSTTGSSDQSGWIIYRFCRAVERFGPYGLGKTSPEFRLSLRTFRWIAGYKHAYGREAAESDPPGGSHETPHRTHNASDHFRRHALHGLGVGSTRG